MTSTREETIARLTAGGLTHTQAAELADADANVIDVKARPVTDPHSMLSRVLELVQTGWCQYEPARKESGRRCEPWDPAARQWSLDGAVELAAREAGSPAEVEAGLLDLVHALEDRAGRELAYWNDATDRTQAEVVELCQTVLAELAGR